MTRAPADLNINVHLDVHLDVDVDVAVVGAGPAGSTAAAALARDGLDVVVLDPNTGSGRDRIGESLPAAAHRPLRAIGVWTRFLADGHQPCHARTSRWGSNQLDTIDAIADLDGPGWLLDRPRFDTLLRTHAQTSGARLLTERVTHTQHDQRGWTLHCANSAVSIRARYLIDARGRPTRAPRPATGPRDRLLSLWTVLDRPVRSADTTHIESAPDGWWYTAPVPTGRRVLAFHTDPDLARNLDLPDALIAHARTASPSFAAHLTDVDWASATSPRACRAGGRISSRREGDHPDARIAIGDASLTFDPLAGQGLFHALYTGLAGANVARAALLGFDAPLTAYDHTLDTVWRTYTIRRSQTYNAEQRWAERPFWRRRQGLTSGQTIPQESRTAANRA